MKIEVVGHGRMSETGSSLLKLIQNNALPTLGLLVRESIQNSSDAALEDASHVKVDFNIHHFYKGQVNRHFEGITDKLNSRYPGDTHKLMEIRDGNTTGLKGPLHYSEAKGTNLGNLNNLVYEISRPQQKEGAGGSWGLGKTIYFRVGIGLVVYYSRIMLEDGNYQSRLAACLVENQDKEDALLQGHYDGPPRGIAWWGTRYKENGTETVAITDHDEIQQIINDFGIRPFEGEETGTSIIIPYIDEEELMITARSVYHKNHENYWWLDNVEDYLRVAVQRWYAPRLENNNYKLNKPLKVTVNDRPVKRKDMLPLFRLVQDLYNYSSYSKGSKFQELLAEKHDIHREKISLRQTFKGTGEAGEIIFVKMSKDQLKMEPPENEKSPYEQANIEFIDESGNPPVICYLRQPGMIIQYDASGSWVSQIRAQSSEEYIIGLFVPNSENEMLDKYDGMSLEEYLRKGEKADHTSWDDWTITEDNPRVVVKIRNNLGKKINEKFEVKDQQSRSTKKSSVGKSLANFLLPPENFGKKPTAEKPRSTKPGSKTVNRANKAALYTQKDPIFQDGEIQIPFEVTAGKNINTAEVFLRVESETGLIKPNTWESDDQIGGPFPLEVSKIHFTDAAVGDKEFVADVLLDRRRSSAMIKHNNEYHFDVSTMHSERFGIPFGVKIKSPQQFPVKISGIISFKSSMHNLIGNLAINHQAGEDKE